MMLIILKLCTLALITPEVDGLCYGLCEINACATAKCENFAKCLPGGMFNYTCECSSYWEGEFCEKPSITNLCYSSPCKQGSTCLLDPAFNAYKCICMPGYTGPACDIQIDVVSW